MYYIMAEAVDLGWKNLLMEIGNSKHKEFILSKLFFLIVCFPNKLWMDCSGLVDLENLTNWNTLG